MKSRALLWTYLVSGNILHAQLPVLLVEEFRKDKGLLLNQSIVRCETSRTTVTLDFLLVNDRDDSVQGRVRLPRVGQGKFPAAFLVVGIETGREVVQMIEGHDSVIVVGIDYPFKGPYDFRGWNAVRTVFALREAAFKTVPRILLCLDWLFRHPLVDTSNVTLVAVSFGVFTGVPAAVIDPRFNRLVVVQGGGDLMEIISASSQRLDVPVPYWLAGWVGSWVLAPFEPNRYIASLAPRPLVLVSGESDLFFPPASVKSLFDHAAEPKEWIRHKSRHVMPAERELIKELANIVARRLYGTM